MHAPACVLQVHDVPAELQTEAAEDQRMVIQDDAVSPSELSSSFKLSQHGHRLMLVCQCVCQQTFLFNSGRIASAWVA